MPCTERRQRARAWLLVLLAAGACGGAAGAGATPGRQSTLRHVQLPAPAAAHDWDEFRRQAALRMVAAHPEISYMGEPPEPLLAIPVLEVELRADGGVRQIRVVRQPRDARDTVRLAIEIVRNAAPYGDMSGLPRPWKFVEVFLFDDARRFKPATLDK